MKQKKGPPTFRSAKWVVLYALLGILILWREFFHQSKADPFGIFLGVAWLAMAAYYAVCYVKEKKEKK